MALVTLAVAAVHIRADWTVAASPVDARDAELQLKVDQASDIILDYLKGRILSVSTITNGSGVATVTTRTPHGMTSNDTVTVRGALEPEYNGAFVATVTSTTTFTYPITGSPGTPATGSVGINAVASWTTSTVPARVQAAVLLMVAHLWERRGDDLDSPDEALWEAIGRLLMRDRDPALA